MKKILAMLFITFTLVSCGKTNYQDLSDKEKKEIQASAFALTLKNFWSILKWENKWEDPAEKAIKEKYPDVDFWDFSELEKDIKNMDIKL